MKIELNKQLDKQVYLDFHEGSTGGVDFGMKIRKDHPNISTSNYIEYIDTFYLEHGVELENIIKETMKCLDDIKEVLFLELERYFHMNLMENNYTCYLSIFDCNPRYLENKSFQVFYRRPFNLRKEVIAHELTHFAFYDFCSKLNIKNDEKLWKLSEIFNVLFLDLPTIREVIGAEELLFYPDLKESLEVVRKVWEEDLKAEDFIRCSISIL